MKPSSKDMIKWVSTRSLYRDDFWYKLKACLKAFGILALIVFVFFLKISKTTSKEKEGAS